MSHFMRCNIRYIVGKDVCICVEECVLDPKCYFVRIILSLSLREMGIVRKKDRRLPESGTALTTHFCAFLSPRLTPSQSQTEMHKSQSYLFTSSRKSLKWERNSEGKMLISS